VLVGDCICKAFLGGYGEPFHVERERNLRVQGDACYKVKNLATEG
jgi:hypothetical protein